MRVNRGCGASDGVGQAGGEPVERIVGCHGHGHPIAADAALEFVRRAFGDHTSVIHHRDSGGQLVGLVEILSGEQHRGPCCGDLTDGAPHVISPARVQAGGRFVEKQDGRRQDQSCRDVEASPHPAGVAGDRPSCGIGQAEAFEQLVGPCARPVLGEPEEAAEHHQVLASGEQFVDGRVLPDQADRASDRTGPAADVVAGHRGDSGVQVDEGGQGPHGRALAGPVGTEQAVDGAGLHGEVEAVEGAGVAVALVEADR